MHCLGWYFKGVNVKNVAFYNYTECRWVISIERSPEEGVHIINDIRSSIFVLLSKLPTPFAPKSDHWMMVLPRELSEFMPKILESSWLETSSRREWGMSDQHIAADLSCWHARASRTNEMSVGSKDNARV